MECPVIDKLHCAGLVGALGACLAVGCNSPAEKSPQSPQGGTAASAPAVQSPVSINAEMVRVVDHAAHQLWNTEREGMAPKTDADWDNIVEHATQVAAAGALIRLEGIGPNDRTFVQQPDWQKFAADVSNAGIAALRAAEAKNHDALVTANGQLVDACEGCHKRFKPALPSEGIMHPHER
jgi:hypothetical protein